MKKLLFLFCLLYAFAVANAQKYIVDWSTYYAGQLTEVTQVSYDSVHNCIFIAGTTADSVGIATPGTHKDNIGYLPVPPITLLISFWRTDGFLAKFDLNGNRIWSTYIGGLSRDIILDMTVDKWGNIYIAGLTGSTTGIATPGTYKSIKTVPDSLNKFIMKFNPDGTQVWGTYIGADDKNYNTATSIDVDTFGNVYLGADCDYSEDDLSTPGAFQIMHGGAKDGLIMKFNPSGGLVWSTYLGGTNEDYISDLAVSPQGYLYVTGSTRSLIVLGTPGTFAPNLFYDESFPYFNNLQNGFVNKFTLDGERVWGTYIPIVDESAYGRTITPFSITADANDNVYVYGMAMCEDGIGTEGVYQPEWAHRDIEFKSYDMFLIKFDPTGQRKWGTYIGGVGRESQVDGSTLTMSGGSSVQLVPDEDAVVVTAGTNSESGLPDSCGYMDYTHQNGFLVCIKTENGQLRWGNRIDDCLIDVKVIYDNNSKDGYQIIGVGKTIYGDLATEGSHQDSKAGFSTSGYIIKLKEDNCGSVEMELEWDEPVFRVNEGYQEYKWYKNDVLVHLSDENVWMPEILDEGYYYVKALKDCCVFLSDTLLIEPSSIKTWPEQTICMYPNPASEEIVIRIPTQHIVEINVYNMIGREVYTDRRSVYSNEYKLQIDNWASGIYFIRIKTNNGTEIIDKFIKR